MSGGGGGGGGGAFIRAGVFIRSNTVTDLLLPLKRQTRLQQTTFINIFHFLITENKT